MCCKSQDISCGMRKIGNWLDHFGIEIALWEGGLVSGMSRVTRRLSVPTRQNSLEHGQPLWFDGLTHGGGNGERVHWMGRLN